MSMQLALFEECQLDDESGKCKDLTAAMEALVTAVDSRSSSSFFQEGILKPSALTLQFGATPLQTAATKLRNAASKFGPEQKAAADKWIKAVANKGSPSALLEEQIALFGECVLSEDGTPSNCQLLDQALQDFQEALETCDITTTCTGEAAVAARPETDMEYRKRMSRRVA